MTADYYHHNFKKFFDQTADIDPSSFLSSFVNTIPSGISVLDLGCGSGRDLLWLKRQGFEVTGFERSPGLADLAREHSGCKVLDGDFETYDFSVHAFDAILASGSLVHIPHKRFAFVLANIIKAFDQHSTHDRFMYISVKEGAGVKKDSDNRIFYLWDDTTLQHLFADFGFKVIDAAKSRSVKNSKDPWIGYVLKLNP